MARGKQTCRILKEIRRQIAEANHIEFVTAECHFKGDCLGTCPKCEAEVRYLEQQLRTRSLSGKTIALAGLSAGMIFMAGATPSLASTADNKSAVESPNDSTAVVNNDNTNVDPDNKIFGMVETMPQFPGGDAKLMEWVTQHLVYPQHAKDFHIEGKVITQFVIEKDGTVSDVKVVRSVCEELDREAIRVIKTLPNFKPGAIMGKPAKVWYTVPVIFKLDD